jgi:hypothetical protein
MGQISGGSAVQLEVVGYMVALAALAVAVLLERTIPGPGEGTDLGAWWAQASPKAVAVWALSERAATAGGVFYSSDGLAGRHRSGLSRHSGAARVAT